MTETLRFARALGRTDRASRQAAIATAAAILALLLSCLLFPDAALGALRVWMDSPTFNHCFLVLPISLFMIWQRRAALADTSVLPNWRAAFAMLALSAAWLVASVAGVLEAKQFAVMTMVQAALFGVLGAAFYRKLAAPFLYLYFLVPSGAFLIPFLQAFTAKFAVAGLHVLHIPVFSNGAVIDIPAGTFAVAEACAGLRFLVAAVAFGVFFAVITYRSWLRRAVFVAVSVVVPVIANGFRALGLIAVAQWIGSPQAALADHIIYGWLFFSLVLVLLVFIGQIFSDRWECDLPLPAAADRPARLFFLPRTLLAVVLCLLAAAVGPLAASLLDRPHLLAMPRNAPGVAPPWRKVQSSEDWRPVIVGPARSFSEAFTNGTYRVDRFVALYGLQGRGNDPVRSNDRDADERMWSFDAARDGVLTMGGRPVDVRVSTWLKGAQKRTVWSFYVVDGRATSDVWTAKWSKLSAWLTGRRCLSAYVALSAVVPDVVAGKAAVNSLLGATEPLSPYLCTATTGQARRSHETAANSISPRWQE
ncbi:MAG: exosortase A [Rhizomicrobium sp.]